MKIWDIIAELVRGCTVPAPPNPFAVDFNYFEALPLPEKMLMSGAVVNFFKSYCKVNTICTTKEVSDG